MNGAEDKATVASAAPAGVNGGATLLWAVTSLDAVPAGSVLINPQSGQPFYNADGSPYRFDPHQPLPFHVRYLQLINH